MPFATGFPPLFRLAIPRDDHLQKALTEKVYQELSQKHRGGFSKAVKARPSHRASSGHSQPVEDVLRWLVG
jgi:hypothetical protein